MYNKNELKIRNKLISDGIVQTFEMYSPIAKSLNDMLIILKILLMIGVLYFFIICIIQKYVLITLLFIITVTLMVMFYLIRKSAKILYLNSKYIGGKHPQNIVSFNNNLKIISYNLSKMQKEEMKLLNAILTVNNIRNVEAIKELRNYYVSTYKFNRKEINITNFIGNVITLYLIPITFGIINIYSTINMDLGVETDIINISYIVFMAIIILSIILILYLIFGIKNFSSTRYYVIPKIQKLLLEIVLNKFMNRSNNNGYNKSFRKNYQKIWTNRKKQYRI